MNSVFGKLNLTDLAKGAVMAVLGALADSAAQVFHTCTTFGCLASFDWGAVLQAALLVGGSYLVKNLISDDQGKVLGAIG